MAAPQSFAAMRNDLVARGLIDPSFRLTDAGHARAEAIKAELLASEAPHDPHGPSVRWDFDFKRRRQVTA